jgi:hypothetical protein
MAVTVLDTETRGAGDSASMMYASVLVGVNGGPYIFTLFGNKIAFWTVTTENLTFLLEVDLSGMATPQINPRLFRTASLTSGGGTIQIVNYESGGNCYAATYTVDNDGLGLITGVTQTGTALLGTGTAGDATITQCVSGLSPRIPFGDDYLDATLTPVTVATTPGNGCHATLVGGDSTIFATARDDCRLKAFEVGSFDVDLGGDQAFNMCLGGSSWIAVIVRTGASYHIQLRDYTTGALLGQVLYTGDGTPSYLGFGDVCLVCIASGSTSNNYVTINVDDATAPFVSGIETVPSGTGYSLQTFSEDTVNIYSSVSAVTLTANVIGSNNAAVLVIKAECPLTPFDPGGFMDCFSLGPFLFIADNGGSNLKIYDISDPTAPVLSETLALDVAPTAVVVLDTVVYLIATNVIYSVNIDNIAGPVQVIEKTEAAGAFLTSRGKSIYSSGSGAGIRLYSVNQAEDDLDLTNYLPPLVEGTSNLAFTRGRIYFADIPTNPATTGRLRGYSLGGIDCHHITAGELSAHEVDAETIRARHGKFKGGVVADSIEVSGIGGFASLKIGDRFVFAGAGSPEGVVTAGPGSVFLSSDGNVYRKSAGSDNTNWVVT